MQFEILIYLLVKISCIFAMAFGYLLLILTMGKIMRKSVQSVNKTAKLNNDPTSVLNQLSQFIHYHSVLKQLSRCTHAHIRAHMFNKFNAIPMYDFVSSVGRLNMYQNL